MKNQHAQPDSDFAALERELADALEAPVLVPARERAMFVEGVAARKGTGSPWYRVAVPAIGVAALIAAIGYAGRAAGPGEPLYPVRQVLSQVGLADEVAAQVESLIDRAETDLAAAVRAEDEGQEFVAVRSAAGALRSLAVARHLLDDVPRADAQPLLSRIDTLENRLRGMLEVDPDDDGRERDDERSGGRDDSGGDDDNSGSGSDDSSGDDDSSGSGSGGDDDNSGSGSDDSGGDDDSSGSGSGGDDDNSGSGSSNSGSGSDDSADRADDEADALEDALDDQQDAQEDAAKDD